MYHHRDNVTAPHGCPNLGSRLHFGHTGEITKLLRDMWWGAETRTHTHGPTGNTVITRAYFVWYVILQRAAKGMGVTPFKAQLLLYVPHGFTWSNSTHCLQSVFLLIFWTSEQRLFLYSRLGGRSESLHVIQVNFFSRFSDLINPLHSVWYLDRQEVDRWKCLSYRDPHLFLNCIYYEPSRHEKYLICTMISQQNFLLLTAIVKKRICIVLGNKIFRAWRIC
jgi:hypothetical protein